MPEEQFRCQNCGKLFSEDALVWPFKDVFLRVAPGEFMPAGECPECGALCHPKGGYPVWLALIAHRHGTNVGLHRSKEAAEREVDDYVAENWEDEIEEPKPEDPKEACRMYFECVGYDEDYEVLQVDLKWHGG